MSNLTLDQLTAATTLANGDLFYVLPSGGATGKSVLWSVQKTAMIAALGASYLQVSNNLSDVASISSARTNLGSTTVGDALFTAASQSAARSALGAGAIGSGVFIASTAAGARGTLGSTTVGDALFIASNQAAGRSALGLATGAITTVGTAATVDVGTSGVTIPLLSTTNAWSNPQTVGTINNLVAGATYLTVESATAGVPAAQFMGSAAAANQVGIRVRSDRTDGYYAIWDYGPSNTIGSVTNTGGGTGIAYNTTSDARLKTKGEAYDPGDIFDRIEIWNFTWDNGHAGVGPFAQELHAVAPALVRPGDDDATKQRGDEGFVAWTVNISEPEAMMMAELKAIRARLAALEAR